MADDRLERLALLLGRQIAELHSELLELRASVTAVKVAVAGILGDDPKAALEHFRVVEKTALESLPASQELQELRDLLAFYEQHRTALGKNKA
jgi:hypothetical protein